jgi:hypothetical protein
MPNYLMPIRALPSYQVLPMQFVCMDGIQGDFLIRPATGTNDIPIGVSQTAYDLPPNIISALSNGTATYTQVAAQPGEEIQIMHDGDVTPVVLGTGGATSGALMTYNSSGAAVMTYPGSGLWFGGVAMEAGNSGEVIDILTHFGKA